MGCNDLGGSTNGNHDDALIEADLEMLCESRHKFLSNESDESREEYLAFTQMMIGLINWLELGKIYRGH